MRSISFYQDIWQPWLIVWCAQARGEGLHKARLPSDHGARVGHDFLHSTTHPPPTYHLGVQLSCVLLGPLPQSIDTGQEQEDQSESRVYRTARVRLRLIVNKISAGHGVRVEARSAPKGPRPADDQQRRLNFRKRLEHGS